MKKRGVTMPNKQQPPARASTGGKTNIQRVTQVEHITVNGPLPHNTEAEDGLLQACLAEPEATDRALKILEVEDFYGLVQRTIFQRLADLRKQGRSYNPSLIIESFQDHPHCDRLELFILELGPFITGGTCTHFAKIVKDCSNRRKQIVFHHKAIETAFNPAEEVSCAY